MSTDLPSPEPMRLRANHANGVTEVRVLVKHIMETGQRHDGSGRVIPPHYITEVLAHHVGAQGTPRLVLQAQWSTAIAQNPVLFCQFKGGAPGDKVVLQWVDNLGARRTDETQIR
ncbi:thiosulfate oxidation carrier complex protein SoxZ [Hylemonella gracilis]|jgi:sulfur-oxidizing protein SoxZ|uniref:Thiosulfate oxidation carrier complex protein SoxZ n=1 Tax=Hylemonella gracilis TaxID=80880 RepID=A0A4P6ULT2_9BURK|nr:thiosulfate oxidation carrier complex protein SoxZ [Hylemonella gracilis]QBK05626.1 thiosulfate oxidation carrier complex protein SoxZ [Hylemonella gracilis]